jgi:cell division septation protein DedD
MKLLLRSSVCALVLLLVAGCSDDKKEEAQRLEQEMLGGERQTDTAPGGELAVGPGDTPSPPSGRPEAVPKEEARPVGLPSQPSGSGYAVQLASCPSSEYAEYLVNRYTKRGYQPWVITYTSPQGEIFFRVRLGFFDSLEEANRVKHELVDKYSINAWVDRVL